MNKKMRELLTKIAQKRAMAKEFLKDDESKDLEKATALMDEADELQKEYDIEARLYETEKEENTPDEEEVKKEKKIDAVKAFADGIRNVLKGETNNETTGIDGGYTVPEDISTKVEELRQAVASLADLVKIEKVSTNSGRRTYKTRAQATGFTKVGEGGKIAQAGKPKFSILKYNIDKYAGYMPVTNELLEDSDANIYDVIVKWLADESRATKNNLILEAIATKKEEDLSNLDGIKNAINVTLGQAFSQTAKIVTNDDGLQYLDTLKDENGRYLLQSSPIDPMQRRLAVGGTTYPLVVITNNVLATKDGKIPFKIGDFEEGIVLFDRQQLNIIASNVASVTDFNAFEEDMTILRGIEREDVEVRDENAFVNGYITSTTSTTSTTDTTEETEEETA